MAFYRWIELLATFAFLLSIVRVEANNAAETNINNETAIAERVALFNEESDAKKFFAELDARLEVLNTAQVNASWIFSTNITNANEAQLVGLSERTTFQY